MLSGLLQPTHLLILLVVALVFLGPKRLPDAGRALGQGLREFRNSVGANHDQDRELPAHGAPDPEKAPLP